jgi:alpha-L-rhamnosidase
LDQPKVARQLVKEIRQQKGRINAGIHGAKAIPLALAENGFYPAAYNLITQPQFPGWAWWINQGATTLWESWDGGASRNHIMFGDISAWFYKYLAGIRPDPKQPGFKHTIIRPYLAPELEWVRAEHESPYGTIHSAWQRQNGQYRLEVHLPANTSGSIYLPKAVTGSLRVGGLLPDQVAALHLTKLRTGECVASVGSGEWIFECELRGKV